MAAPLGGFARAVNHPSPRSAEAARAFYLRCAELVEYPNASRTLVLAIETMVAAFE